MPYYPPSSITAQPPLEWAPSIPPTPYPLATTSSQTYQPYPYNPTPPDNYYWPQTHPFNYTPHNRADMDFNLTPFTLQPYQTNWIQAPFSTPPLNNPSAQAPIAEDNAYLHYQQPEAPSFSRPSIPAYQYPTQNLIQEQPSFPPQPHPFFHTPPPHVNPIYPSIPTPYSAPYPEPIPPSSINYLEETLPILTSTSETEEKITDSNPISSFTDKATYLTTQTIPWETTLLTEIYDKYNPSPIKPRNNRRHARTPKNNIRSLFEGFYVTDLTNENIQRILNTKTLNNEERRKLRTTIKNMINHLLENINPATPLHFQLKKLHIGMRLTQPQGEANFTNSEIEDCIKKCFESNSKIYLKFQWCLHTLASFDEIIQANLSEITETEWISYHQNRYPLTPPMKIILKRVKQFQRQSNNEDFLFYNQEGSANPLVLFKLQKIRFIEQGKGLHQAFSLTNFQHHKEILKEKWPEFLAKCTPPPKATFQATDKLMDVFTTISNTFTMPSHDMLTRFKHNYSSLQNSVDTLGYEKKLLKDLDQELLYQICIYLWKSLERYHAQEVLSFLKRIIHTLQTDCITPKALYKQIDSLDEIFKTTDEQCAKFIQQVHNTEHLLSQNKVTLQEIHMLQFQLISGKSEDFIAHMRWKHYHKDYICSDSSLTAEKVKLPPELQMIIEAQPKIAEDDLIFFKPGKGRKNDSFQYKPGFLTKLYPYIQFNIEKGDIERYLNDD